MGTVRIRKLRTFVLLLAKRYPSQRKRNQEITQLRCPTVRHRNEALVRHLVLHGNGEGGLLVKSTK